MKVKKGVHKMKGKLSIQEIFQMIQKRQMEKKKKFNKLQDIYLNSISAKIKRLKKRLNLKQKPQQKSKLSC